MKIAKCFFTWFFFIVAGCQSINSPIDWNDTQSIAAQISSTRDESRPLITYEGPAYDVKDIGRYLIRAWKYDKDNSVTYQIYVRDHYSDDSGFYGSAYDSDGNKLNTVPISREDGSCITGTCWYYTPLGINMEHDYFKKFKDTGISVTLLDKTGENIFFIPPAYIKAFLGKVS